MGIAITRAAAGGRRGRVAFTVRLILLLDQNRFALFSNGTRLSPRRLVVECGSLGVHGLRTAVESAAKATLGVQVRYLALLGLQIERNSAELIVAVRALERSRLLALFPDIVSMDIDKIRGLDRFTAEFKYVESAHSWAALTDPDSTLDQSVRDIFARSISYLDRGLCEVDGYYGWDQYQDRAGVGALSTAQGLLCHVYAGCGSGIVHRAAATLEALQNKDGGWPVRLALIAGASANSITESTCACLWALCEAGRTLADGTIERGVAWLQKTQCGGGWRSSEFRSPPHVTATSAAVHTLAMLGRSKAVEAGVEWLRRAQADDGGWMLEAPGAGGANGETRPAYTAHAVVALLAAGVPKDDPAIVDGLAYLGGAYHRSCNTPWESTQYNYRVDEKTPARLLFRIFASPWVLAALILGGCDLADSRIQFGLERLLAMQEPNGAWRADVGPDGLHPVWAAHDALFALKVFADTVHRSPSAHFLVAHQTAEFERFEHSLPYLLGGGVGVYRRRRLLRTVVLSAVGAVMAGLALTQLGLLDLAQSFSWLQQPLAAVALAFLSIGGVVVPAVIIEEYKFRRATR